jgi:hypothetical protein
MAERESEGGGLGHSPLFDDEAVFSELFGGPATSPMMPPSSEVRIPATRRAGSAGRGRDADRSVSGRAATPPRPTHYRIVSFSLYVEDIARLDELVRRLKSKGYSKANKSQVIRYALATVDIDAMPTHL